MEDGDGILPIPKLVNGSMVHMENENFHAVYYAKIYHYTLSNALNSQEWKDIFHKMKSMLPLQGKTVLLKPFIMNTHVNSQTWSVCDIDTSVMMYMNTEVNERNRVISNNFNNLPETVLIVCCNK